MRLHRFIGNFDLSKEEIRITDPELRNQVIKVLRLRAGDEIELSDGRLNEARVKIADIGKDMRLSVSERWQNQNEPDRQVILYCSVLKKENFELVVQKATEIGVKEIVPIITARTIKLDIRKDRLEKIIREAAEQSGRGIVPTLHEPIKFGDAIKRVGKGTNFIFDISGETLSRTTLAAPAARGQANYLLRTTIFIGPEGGWTPEELELAKKNNFKIISLGKTTLRAETAAIVGTYLIVHNS